VIGWSRRAREDSRRRRAWWASLSDEERALEERRSAEERRLAWTLFLVPVPPLAVLLAAWAFAPDSVLLPVVGAVLFPVGLAVDAIWVSRRVSRIR